MNMFKRISCPFKVAYWLDMEKPYGFPYMQWVRSLVTYCLPFIGSSEMDNPMLGELHDLMRENDCVITRHKKGRKKTTYDYAKFLEHHWEKVKDKHYMLLRMAIHLFDEGDKAAALLIYDAVADREEDEEYRAALLVRRLYFLNAGECESYISALCERPEYQFVRQYRRAWGIALLYQAEDCFNKGKYDMAEGYLSSITNDEEYSRSAPLVYLYARQMQGDISFHRGQFDEAMRIYSDVAEAVNTNVHANYLHGVERDSVSIAKMLEELRREMTGSAQRMNSLSVMDRGKVIKSLVLGRLVEDNENLRRCYKATDVDISIRCYVTLSVGIFYRGQSARLAKSHDVKDVGIVLSEVRALHDEFEVMKGGWVPFSQAEQAEHAFFIAEQLLRLGDITTAVNLYRGILNLSKDHLPTHLRLAELRFLGSYDEDGNEKHVSQKEAVSKAKALREDVNHFKRCLSECTRANKTFQAALNYFICETSLRRRRLHARSAIAFEYIDSWAADFRNSLDNLTHLMSDSPLGFYWHAARFNESYGGDYVILDTKRLSFPRTSVAELKRVARSYRDIKEPTSLERYLMRHVFGTDNVAIVNRTLREVRDGMNLYIEEREAEERRQKVHQVFEEAVSVFLGKANVPNDEEVMAELGLAAERRVEFERVVDELLDKHRFSLELMFEAFRIGEMRFAGVDVTVPFVFLRNRGLAKIRLRECKDGKVSFVLFKEDGDFVQGEVTEGSLLGSYSGTPLFQKLLYLAFLNGMVVSQDQIQTNPFGDIRFLSDIEDLRAFQTALTRERNDLRNVFSYLNPVVDLVFQRTYCDGLGESSYMRMLRQQLEIQRHLLVFKKSAYDYRLDEEGHLVLDLDDFAESPLRKFFEAAYAEIQEGGKILFKFMLHGNREIKGKVDEGGRVLIFDIPQGGIEYGFILEFENFLLHLLNASIFGDVRKIAQSKAATVIKEKRYARISRLIGYPGEMLTAFNAIYRKRTRLQKSWKFEDTPLNPFTKSPIPLFVLVSDDGEARKYRPLYPDATLSDGARLFQPRFTFASKSLIRQIAVDERIIKEYILNCCQVSEDCYLYGYEKEWSDATEGEQKMVLDIIGEIRKGNVSDPLLVVDPTHSLGISFGWKDLRIQKEDGQEVERVRRYYTYVPPYVQIVELLGEDRSAVVEHHKVKVEK